ncbi:hypothetical protein [Thiomicrorhabdus sp.]|uniref:hypothetical protein n=1 Tax=Thiomicrorhabdus sp. TaxID=2039724 RepID=UPI0029C97254|nr:hypothetical protein [Thiomicrorhabdus sp.]
MHPQLNIWFQILSLGAVILWLYFTFIEKSLVSKVFEGQALLIDLLFGLPLVLALAVVIYASVFWSLKLVLVIAFPQFLEQVEVVYEEDEDTLKHLESEHGEAYWDAAEEPEAGRAKSMQNSASTSKKTADQNHLNRHED